MSDIVHQLRDRQVCSEAHNSCRNDWRMEQAADEIERLLEVIKPLAQEVSRYHEDTQDGMMVPAYVGHLRRAKEEFLACGGRLEGER